MRQAHAKTGSSYKEEPPDIFRAARDDDIYELRLALKDGQSIRSSQPVTSLTPLHIAAMRGSVRFVKVAMAHDPGAAWLQDGQLRTPFDHAAARRDRQSMAYLHNAMYPESTIEVPEHQ